MKLLKAEAGVNDGKAGLLSAAGLFAKGGIFDKKSESFNIQELDPYLLFDARSSMLGTLENPTLDLDPATPSTLDVITATRAGVATYTDADGNIATASPDTVRVDYVDSVPMILVEPSATNLLPYSEDFSNSAWTKTNTSVTGGFTSPDGTENAFLMTDDSTDSKHVVYELDICPQDSSIYTRSVFVKKGTARYIVLSCRHTPTSSGTSWIYDTDANDWASIGSSGVGQSIEIYGNGWVRLSISHISNSNFNNDFSIGIANGATVSDASYSGSGNSVYIWGAQLETGSVATSLIPTSGGDAAARTRAADDLVISGSAFSDFYNQSEGTLYLEAQKRDAGSVYNFTIGNGTLANRIAATYNSIFVTQGGTGNTATSITLPNNQLYRLAASFKSGDSKVSVNGSSEAAVAASTLPTSTGITLGGRQDDTNAQKLNGHIKRLIYWPYHSDSL